MNEGITPEQEAALAAVYDSGQPIPKGITDEILLISDTDKLTEITAVAAAVKEKLPFCTTESETGGLTFRRLTYPGGFVLDEEKAPVWSSSPYTASFFPMDEGLLMTQIKKNDGTVLTFSPPGEDSLPRTITAERHGVGVVVYPDQQQHFIPKLLYLAIDRPDGPLQAKPADHLLIDLDRRVFTLLRGDDGFIEEDHPFNEEIVLHSEPYSGGPIHVCIRYAANGSVSVVTPTIDAGSFQFHKMILLLKRRQMPESFSLVPFKKPKNPDGEEISLLDRAVKNLSTCLVPNISTPPTNVGAVTRAVYDYPRV